jgi:hypothetical protein
LTKILFTKESSIPLQNGSSLFVSSCRTGKTFRLLNWVDLLQKDNKKFLYIITKYHANYEAFSELRENIFKVLIGDTYYISNMNINESTVNSIIDKAILYNLYIFIDETKDVKVISDLLISNDYKNFVMTMQSLSDLEYFGIDVIRFDNLFIGRCNSFVTLDEDIDLKHIKSMEFIQLSKME